MSSTGGELLLGRVLVRHRPARLAVTKPELLLRRQASDLCRPPVDVETQAVALPPMPGGTLSNSIGAGAPLRLIQPETQVEGLERVKWSVKRRPALLRRRDLAPGRRRKAQGPLRGDGRVELAGPLPGGGLRQVDEGLLALGVRAGARSEPRSRRGACRPRRALPALPGAGPSSRHRDLADGADVLRDVLADLAVAAGRGLHQHAVLVAQVDSQPIELELGHVLHRRRVVSQANSRRTRASKFLPVASMSVSVRIDSMGTTWRTFSKPSRATADAVNVGRQQFRGARPPAPAIRRKEPVAPRPQFRRDVSAVVKWA